MKIVRKSVVCFVVLVGLMVFGAWTPANTANTETRYVDAEILATYATETVMYTNRTITYNETVNTVPQYVPLSGLPDSCGAVAGSVLVGFYDKYFPDLIPGWQSYYSNGSYRRQDATYVPALMQDLYTRMRTNVDDVGVSEQDFLSGLRSYVIDKGYSITYSSVATTTSLNYAACKSEIDSNKPVAILSAAGDIYTISTSEGKDSITSYNVTENHIMVAYGYTEIKYYNGSSLFRTDVYLNVITAKPGITQAYYKTSPHNLKAAYAVTIS